MHLRVEEWHERIVKRGTMLGAYPVHGVTEKEFTPEDSQFFGITWTPVPCKALEVRITQPHLPHGAKGPARRVRRTMLPWFCGLQKDLELLEIPEGGTWTDLSRAHLSRNRSCNTIRPSQQIRFTAVSLPSCGPDPRSLSIV